MTLESDVADAVPQISKTREDILTEIEDLVSHQDRINKLYHFIKHGDHDTREHAWNILEGMYDEHAVRDFVTDTQQLAALKKSSKEN